MHGSLVFGLGMRLRNVAPMGYCKGFLGKKGREKVSLF